VKEGNLARRHVCLVLSENLSLCDLPVQQDRITVYINRLRSVVVPFLNLAYGCRAVFQSDDVATVYKRKCPSSNEVVRLS
jgi:hypothetical protein